MSGHCHHRSTCRLCAGTDLTLVIRLEPTPPANAFLPADALEGEQKRFPLDVFFCESCGHLQLLDVVDPRVLFENYVYVSGTSPVFVRHFRDYAEDIIARLGPGQGTLVVDVGSNDGTLLRFFKEAGHAVLGIDPAREIASRATESGIDTLATFFTPELARSIRKERGPAAIVTANNVIAHIDNLAGVVEGVRRLIAPDGVFVFEVSYLVDVLEKTLFDTIYHEHLAYHSIKPLRRFLYTHGMELIEALRVDSHGGSLRGIAQTKGGPRPVGASVDELTALEQRLGLDRADTFRRFAQNIEALREDLGSLLQRLKGTGKRIAGFGAPAKATTLMYHFGIGPDLIDFIVDDSPFKQGLYSPGMHIPVVPADVIYERRPDYLLILAWNFAEPIMKKHAAFHEAGGRFIVPLPNVKVI
ncbi:MAG: methyltransferase domain-containing protein [Acidiferrobacterales bacterium]